MWKIYVGRDASIVSISSLHNNQPQIFTAVEHQN
jgi:hypothetical protein